MRVIADDLWFPEGYAGQLVEMDWPRPGLPLYYRA
jgi:hypothetical protein